MAPLSYHLWNSWQKNEHFKGRIADVGTPLFLLKWFILFYSGSSLIHREVFWSLSEWRVGAAEWSFHKHITNSGRNNLPPQRPYLLLEVVLSSHTKYGHHLELFWLSCKKFYSSLDNLINSCKVNPSVDSMLVFISSR